MASAEIPPLPSSRARWQNEDTAMVLRGCDVVFGLASAVMVTIAVVYRLRGETSTLTVVLLAIFPVLNLTLSQLGRRHRWAAEWVRLALNAPLVIAIEVASDGALAGMWLPTFIVGAGGSLVWPALTRDVRHGYAATVWAVLLLAVPAAVVHMSVPLTIWRCLSIGLVGVVLSAAIESTGVALMIARNRRAEAERHQRDLRLSLDQLDERTRGLRLVLDSVAQGFITIDRDGVMIGERSAIVERWFGEPGTVTSFAELLARHDPEVAAWFVLGLDSLRQGFLPPELCLEQLPKRVVGGGRTLELEYRPIVRNADERLLLIVSDVTGRIERERAERAQRETIALFQRITADRSGFDEFMEEATTLIETLASAADPITERRALHTLKGTCSIYGLEGFVERCHRIEQELAETGAVLTGPQRAELAEAWREQTMQVQRLVGDVRRDAIEIEAGELTQLVDRARHGASGRDLAPVLASWRHESVARRFERLGTYATDLSRRLDKGDLELVVSAGGIRLDAARWAPFWGAMVHAVRNAVDHGLDGARARAAAGKPARARLGFSATRADGQLAISISDDGAGIDWADVRARAEARGLAADSQADLEQALFADGFSTREAVTQTSGRGVGLTALRAAVEQLGGRIELDSRAGRGTTLRCRFPDPDAGLVQPIRALA